MQKAAARLPVGGKSRKWVPLLGAFIVFFTFVVKDGLRDNAKDLAAQIDSAEALFKISLDSSAMSLQLMKIQMDVRALRNKVEVNHNTADELSQAMSRAEDIRIGVHEGFEDAVELFSVLPPNKDLTEAQHTLERTIEKMDASVADLQKDIEKDPAQRVLGLVKAALTDEATGVGVAIFGDHVLTYAKAWKKTADARYRVFSWISYFLYTVGWLILLVDRLRGGEEVLAE